MRIIQVIESGNERHAILLSARGYKNPDISALRVSHRDRVSVWIDRWHEKGGDDLYDQPRSGKPMIYNTDELTYFKDAVDKHPQQLGLAKADLEQNSGKTFSENTLKRALKKALDTAESNVGGR